MKLKVLVLFSTMTFFWGLPLFSLAEEKAHQPFEMKHHHMIHPIKDERVSLGLSPEMKHHQLANMRSHLEAVQAITGFIAEKEFVKASDIAKSRLGLNEEMRNMCDSFGNEDFTALGLAFHRSADELSEVLKTEDLGQSLNALQKTLSYCVQCHKHYRQ